MRHALILAGGSGTRLWPYSTASLPKQLVPLLAGRSLLDVAVSRATTVVPAERVWLGAGEQLRSAVSAVPGLSAERLILEPSGRDTLPAVALGCATILAADPEAVVAVLTADHLIEPIDAFAATLSAGFALAESSDRTLVTFGVVPDAPATGFGYLELGEPLAADARVVTRFREKPDAAAAQSFVDAGPSKFLWNSGMFVWRATTLLAAVDAFEPETGRLVREVVAGRTSAWDELAKKSVDYGVMEPASTSPDFAVAALPMSARWLDVGSWRA
jgi:mannose-1-phosphate guanylyltransferase